MISGFKGTYFHQIDDKKRMRLPSKLRDAIKGSYCVSEGNGTYLCVYTEDYAEKLAKKFSEQLLQAKTLEERTEIEEQERDTFSTMFDVCEDKQGRFGIPDNRLEYANITKNIVILGINDRIEIWAQEVYDEYIKRRKNKQ